MGTYLLLVCLLAWLALCLDGPGAAAGVFAWLVYFPLWLLGQLILAPGRLISGWLCASWSAPRHS